MGLKEYRKKRDFRRTPEPSGGVHQANRGKKTAPGPMFVVQKHAARRLHYDFRLEHDGVLKSWAVPKGPSLDPQEKRLAVEVEDHPLEYGAFEGTIPKGEYGGGSVLLWDAGRWIPEDNVADGLRKGHLRFRLEGHKLRGSWNLVRLRDSAGDKPQWLLIKSRDEEAKPQQEHDIVAEKPQSVVSKRTIEQISETPGEVWHSNRPSPQSPTTKESAKAPENPLAQPAFESPDWHDKAETVRPMLAMLEDAPLQDPRLIYEPKYDGIRGVVLLEPGPGGKSATVRIWSRLGNDKTHQFPEIVRVLKDFGRKLKAGVLLDGEIVALDDSGKPTGFQQLQGRVHLTGLKEHDVRIPTRQGVAFIAFDILRDGAKDLRGLPLVVRRARLERVLKNAGSPLIRLSEFQPHDGTRLYRQAMEEGWEGLIAKNAESPYRTGKRSSDWRKLKIVWRQECVVGGWTEPRQSRSHFGALLLGVYDKNGLTYIGHTGTGFTETELTRVSKLLRKLERSTCPFVQRPKSNERPHWVEPKLVVEVKFTEWTADGKLRHPVYLGLRDDIDPLKVRREPTPTLHSTSARLEKLRHPQQTLSPQTISPGTTRPTTTHSQRTPRTQLTRQKPQPAPSFKMSAALERLLDAIHALEERRRAGVLDLPNGDRLEVGNLEKVFWPGLKITKGELLRYYVQVSSVLLPAVEDRALVMRRFPNGIKGKAFYQQRAPEHVPAGVRVETVRGDEEVPSRLVGGSLTTLLYMAQLAVVSQDPWFSRVQSPDIADYVALDLDPMPGMTWSQVCDVARWAHEELDRFGVLGFPKTSGSSGLHIYIPLQPGTPYEPGRIFCQMIATILAHKHPKVATVARSVHARGRTLYVDYLQNIRGKTLATAYSARASDFAGVSMPLTWKEVDEEVRPQDFTIRTALSRLREIGDVWAAFRSSKGADLRAVLDKHR
jgi:bifunctional non-homologous end joining protein LigD